MRVGRTLGEMAVLQLIQAMKRSLLSVTTGGRSIVAGYFSCQWQLEIGIRQGQESTEQIL